MTFSTYSQNSEIFLWPHKTPIKNNEEDHIVKVEEKLGIVTKITNVDYPSFVVFKPKDYSNGKGIIVCPGGSYNILAIDLEGYEVAEWLNKLGYTVFVLKYSVPNKEEAALNDLKRAIRLVRNSTGKYSLNPSKIGVLGFSAGANLCARASTLYQKESYTEIDEIDEVSCRPDFTLLIYPAFLDKGKNGTLSQQLEINNNTPPMFVFGTKDDIHANSSLVMEQALREAKVPVELHFLAEGGHGYGLRKGNIAAETWTVFAETWLKRIDLK